MAKNDQSKVFARKMRATLLKNADKSSTFMDGEDFALTTDNREQIGNFFIDAYPVHWFLHLLHAAEIVGYKCPIKTVADYWRYFYLSGVWIMHLNPETEEQMDTRLADNLSC